MQIERKRSVLQALGLLAMLAVGLALRAADPAAAQTEGASTIDACRAEEIAPTGEREWAVPPMQTRPGEPY